MQALLVRYPFGRILLHFACACRDGKHAWHWRGIVRELCGR